MESWRQFVPVKYLVLGGIGLGIWSLKYYLGGARCRSKALMLGKTVVITGPGANSGIGKETAKELARRKARLVLACRDVNKAEQTAQEIIRAVKDAQVVVHHLDLASFKSVRQFASIIGESEDKIDVLINNAGVFQCPYTLTEDGLEMQMGVNHYGHFLLTSLLVDKLKAASKSRVVIVSSGLAKIADLDFENLNGEKGYNKRNAYNVSKLANMMFSRELARRLENSSVHVHCLHPGMARTGLARHVPLPKIAKILLYPLYWLLVKSAWEGCQTVVYCAVAEEISEVTGRYYGSCKEEPWLEIASDEDSIKKMWDISVEKTKSNILV